MTNNLKSGCLLCGEELIYQQSEKKLTCKTNMTGYPGSSGRLSNVQVKFLVVFVDITALAGPGLAQVFSSALLPMQARFQKQRGETPINLHRDA